MRPSDEDVRNALRTVIDPELSYSLVDLNMVRQIDIVDDRVTIHLMFTIPGCPLVGWIIQNICQVVGALPGVEGV